MFLTTKPVCARKPLSRLKIIRLLLGIGLLYSLTLQAGTYKWVDAQGKVHFSDKPPPESAQQKEDISEQLKQVNTDTSNKTTQQVLRQIEVDKTARQRETYDTEKPQKAREQRQKENCQRAKRELRILEGRVIFVDENGKEIKTTEKERERRAQTLAEEIKKYCH